jgi:hypothetical protein
VSDSREALALRKDLLAARASLQRLTLAREAVRLRESLGWQRTAAAIATLPAARSLLFGLVLLVAGKGKVARLVRIAGAAIGLARLALALAGRR